MKLSLPLALLFLAGCAEVTQFKTDSDGYYRFKKHPIEVQAPDPSCSVFDTEKSVDFLIGAGYWNILGDHAVQVFVKTPEVSTDDGFIRYCKAGSVSRFVENDRKPAGFNFKALNTEMTEINGRPAMLGVGVDRSAKTPAVFLVAAVSLDTRLVFASVFFPLKNESDADLAQLDNYTGFKKWVATVHEIKRPTN